VIAIQRSDRMLWLFRTVTEAWHDQTSSSPRIDSSPTAWKRASGNSSKSLIAIHGRIESYGPFKPSIQRGSTRHHHHRESIPHPLHGKGKFDRDPTVRSKVVAFSNSPSSLVRQDLIITENRFLIHAMEKDIRKLQ